MGKVVESRDLEISEFSSDILEIETSYYSGGIYYLAISNEDGVVSKSKFIVTEK